MERRHEEEMTAFIERLLKRGWNEVEWIDFYRWFGVTKLHKRAYRDFYQSVEEVSGQKGIALSIKSNSEKAVFVIGKVDNYKDWFKDE